MNQPTVTLPIVNLSVLIDPGQRNCWLDQPPNAESLPGACDDHSNHPFQIPEDPLVKLMQDKNKN